MKSQCVPVEATSDPRSMARLKVSEARGTSTVTRPSHTPSWPPQASRSADPPRVGPYELIERLRRHAIPTGAGDLEAVELYRARALEGPAARQSVALKCLRSGTGRKSAMADLFAREAWVAAAVDHPNVCQLLGFGATHDEHYIALEWLSGLALSRAFATLGQRRALVHRRQHCQAVARIIAELAKGLHAVHEVRDAQGTALGVVHRAIQPENLFVLHDGGVRLKELGMARPGSRERRRSTVRSGPWLYGSVAYAAPEQLQRPEVDRRVDIWALAVVAWELLTGERLFARATPQETALAVMGDPIPPPSAINPAVAPALEDVLVRALARDPDQRVATAQELARALEDALSLTGGDVSAAGVAGWLAELLPPPARRLRAC